MSRAEAIEAALFPGGHPANVNRIEIEVQPTGNIRWTVWDDAKRLLTVALPPSQALTMLQSTAILVSAATQAAAARN